MTPYMSGQDGGSLDPPGPHGGSVSAPDVAALLALSDERDLWQRFCLERERAAYLAGYEDGERAGYERGARQLEESWPAVVRPVLQDRPSHAELEERRWGPGGRRQHLHLVQEADR